MSHPLPIPPKSFPPCYHLLTRHHSLILDRILGKGSFGTVYLATSLLTLRQYAVKHVSVRKRWLREIAMHRAVSSHPHIVELYEAYEDEEGWWLILEYCNAGDLYEYIHRQRSLRKLEKYDGDDDPVTEGKRRIQWFLQLADATRWCHERGISHMDLKPENVLLHWTGSSSQDQVVVKLTDFGLSTSFRVAQFTQRGSAAYMAPELIPSLPHHSFPTHACDIWSLGILLINLLTNTQPWQLVCHPETCIECLSQRHEPDSQYEYFRNNQERNTLKEMLGSGITDEADRLIKTCLHENGWRRCRASELCDRVRKVTTEWHIQPSATVLGRLQEEVGGQRRRQHDNMFQAKATTTTTSRYTSSTSDVSDVTTTAVEEESNAAVLSLGATVSKYSQGDSGCWSSINLEDGDAIPSISSSSPPSLPQISHTCV